jgi:hypothetical protein
MAMGIELKNVRVHDLGLAAALISCGFMLRATTRDRNGRFYFEFRQTGNLIKAIDDYWVNTLVVPARLFTDNLKMLKNKIYSEE